MTRRFAIVLTAATALAAAPGARAADPAEATLSRAQPQAAWTGSVSNALSYTTFFLGQGQCLEGSCDTFVAKVADPGATALRVLVTVSPATDAAAFEVVKPDGEKVYAPARLESQVLSIKNPAPGAYTINVVPNTGLGSDIAGDVKASYPELPPPPAPAVVAPPAVAAPPAPAPAAKPKPSTCRRKARRIKSAKRRRAALKRCRVRAA